MKEIQAGDMLAAAWGYDQTNITYFKVLKRTNNTVTVQEWEQQFVKDAGYLAEYITAGEKPKRVHEGYEDENGNWGNRTVDAKPIRKKVHVLTDIDKPTEFLKMNSYMWAYPVDPKAELLQTHYH
jgi:hypothetical protein